MFTLKKKEKNNNLDFKGKIYFDYIIKLFFLFIINEFYFITITTKWGINIFLKVDGHLYSFIIYVLLGLSLWFISNSQRLSLIVLNSTYFIIGMISVLKLNYIGIPFLLSDVSFVNSVDSILELITIKDVLNVFTIQPIKQIVCLFLMICSIIFVNKKKTMLSKKTRCVSSPIFLIIMLVMFIPNIFNTFVVKSWQCVNTEMYYASMGLYSGLCGKLLNEKVIEPENYNKKEIEDNLNNNTNIVSINNKWGTPNIIYVLSEAYWDIDKIEEVTFNEDIMKDYNELKENESVKVLKTISPTYAGITANTEFEVLTGMSLNYFEPHYIPFNQLYNNKNTRETYPSIVKTLKDNGYKTYAYSPMDDGTLYNLKNIYNYIGFDNVYFFDDVYEDKNSIKGQQISEKALISRVINDINNYDNPYFCYVKTIQNHMPYNADKYRKEEMKVSIKDTSLNEEMTFRCKLYAQGIYDSNIELKRLYEEIQKLEEPTIIVYFGDHLPSLTTSNGEDIIENLSIVNTNNNLVNDFNKYCTETIILSNYDINISDDISTMSFFNLSPYVLSHLNLDVNSSYYNYFTHLYSLTNIYTGGNKNFICDKYGNLYDINNMDSKIEKTYKYRENIQYYFLKK